MTNKDIQINFASSFSRALDARSEPFTVNLQDLNTGINFLEKYIVKVTHNQQIEWVVSRVCDHANGTLHPCDDKLFAACPLHGWKLDLKSLLYSNVDVKKKKIEFTTHDGTLVIEHRDTHLEFPKDLQENPAIDDLNIRFLAHACLQFSCGDINIITDPWLNGPCFANGWWHYPPPTIDANERLFKADVIYISHNHPDHMHIETLLPLVKERPDVPIIIPNFKTKSAERPLRKLGFTNVLALAFNQIYRVNPGNVYISILKSGDFRDDSGLYINYGGRQALITVDSSILNQLVLPTGIDFLATSFAGGASGYPWCFDHHTEEQKQTIAHNRHLSVKNSILDYIHACQPKS